MADNPAGFTAATPRSTGGDEFSARATTSPDPPDGPGVVAAVTEDQGEASAPASSPDGALEPVLGSQSAAAVAPDDHTTQGFVTDSSIDLSLLGGRSRW